MFEQSGPDEQGISVDLKRFVGASIPKASDLLRRIHNTQRDNNRFQERNLNQKLSANLLSHRLEFFPTKTPIIWLPLD